jgi:hypothetical protein
MQIGAVPSSGRTSIHKEHEEQNNIEYPRKQMERIIRPQKVKTRKTGVIIHAN